LLKELPEYHLEKVKLEVTSRDPMQLIESMAALHDPSSFERVMNDIKFSGDGWWVLVHPSNTEPVIRILAESRDATEAASLLRQYQDELQSLLGAA
jgi:phosphomannomutase/phosphoglucomutase